MGFNLNEKMDRCNNTEYAVKVFQRNRNLSDDGVVGANTWRYLVDGKVINTRVRLKNNAKDIDAYSIPLEFYNHPIKIVNETKETLYIRM